MKTSLLTGASLCALFMAFNVAAQAPAASARPLIGGHGDNVQAFIAEFDDNGDGKVTWSEFEAFRRVRFDATDTNHDGTVNEDEYVGEFQARKAQEFDRERTAQLEQARTRFAALDKDHDGKVSRAEFDAAGQRTWDSGQQALASSTKGKPSGTTPRQTKSSSTNPRLDNAGRNALGMPSGQTAPGFLTLYDDNGDGKVDRDEFSRARDAQFARSDRDGDGDGDGALTGDEYLSEYEERLDRRIVDLNQGQDRQAHVRFGVLDTDKDDSMTFAEYQASGRHLFDTADRNHDGVVELDDARQPAPTRTPS